jgi:phosphoribosylglycinamide formyltransferase-1
VQLPTPVKIVVLASGSGTLLQSVIDAAERPAYPVRVLAVGSDRAGVGALERAEQAGIPHFIVKLADHADRAEWDRALTEAVAAYQPDLVVSAGFRKILGSAFLARFDNRVLNTHPALSPAFPGAHAVRDTLAYGAKVAGCTVHFMDTGVDTGPIIVQEAVVIEPQDDEDLLHERIKAVERRLLVQALERLARGGCTVEGRKVSFS